MFRVLGIHNFEQLINIPLIDVFFDNEGKMFFQFLIKIYEKVFHQEGLMGVILGVHFLEVHLVAFFDDVNSKPIFGDALEKACRCEKEV